MVFLTSDMHLSNSLRNNRTFLGIPMIGMTFCQIFVDNFVNTTISYLLPLSENSSHTEWLASDLGFYAVDIFIFIGINSFGSWLYYTSMNVLLKTK